MPVQKRYCPGCGQESPTEQQLEGAYILTACALCGLGLGLKVASAEEQRRFKGLPEPTPEPALTSSATNPGLLPQPTNPALQSSGSIPALQSSGSNPALRPQPTNPALQSSGSNPALQSSGSNPALTSGSRPALAPSGTPTPAGAAIGNTPSNPGTGGPALARVGVVRREMSLNPIVERPGPADARNPEARSSRPPGVIVPPPLESVETLAPSDSIEAQATEGGTMVRQMKRVVVVEDSQFLREVTRDLLVERRLAREVVEMPDGNAFLEDFVRASLADKKPDLVVLDVRMPGLDGREAALAMRAIEAGFGLKRTPILFFSAVLCDEPFKALLAELKNAKYIRKAEGGDVRELGERIAAVLERLVGGK